MEISGLVPAGAAPPRDGQQIKSFPSVVDGHVLKISKRTATAGGGGAGGGGNKQSSGGLSAAAAKAAQQAGQRVIRVDWQNNCTRKYFADQTLVQPALNCKGKVICIACAMTCHMPQYVLCCVVLCARMQSARPLCMALIRDVMM